jgi:hypothetical protein
MPQLTVNLSSRANTLFRQQWELVARQTDRMLVGLLILQWIAAIAIALWISPRTWIGASSQIHLHVWLALVFGGCDRRIPDQHGSDSTWPSSHPAPAWSECDVECIGHFSDSELTCPKSFYQFTLSVTIS